MTELLFSWEMNFCCWGDKILVGRMSKFLIIGGTDRENLRTVYLIF